MKYSESSWNCSFKFQKPGISIEEVSDNYLPPSPSEAMLGITQHFKLLGLDAIDCFKVR
jgi:hypothetical protein